MDVRIKSEEIDASSLNERLERKVVRAGIKNCAQILLTDPIEFKKRYNFSDSDVEQLKHAAADAINTQGFVAVSELNNVYPQKWKTLTSGCSALDTILGGGIPVRGITELFGVSGAGKTQFGLQFSVTVQYPEEHGGLNAGSVYICTEDRFPSKRLQQMLPHFPREGLFDENILEHAADHIYVDHIPDVESMMDCLNKRLPALLQNNQVGLVVVDSIAALFRSDYTNRQMKQRAKDLRAIGVQLHKLSSAFNLSVLCINQVTDSLETNKTLPALGLVWANLVTTKLKVSVRPEGRILTVASSPELPFCEFPYQITLRGVEGL